MKAERIKTNLELNTSNILKASKAMRVIPAKWWYRLSNDTNIPYRKLVNLIHGLKKNGFLEFKDSLTDDPLIGLTEKGFTRGEEYFESEYPFRSLKRMTNVVGSKEPHQYLMFRFLVDYFCTNENPKKILTYKEKGCRLSCKLPSESEIYIIPDILIYDNEGLTMVEADTGLELGSRIYQKLLKYFYIAIFNKYEYPTRKFNIYFSLPDDSRSWGLFHFDKKHSNDITDKNAGSVFRLFEQFSNGIKVSKYTTVRVKTEDIINLFKEDIVNIFVGNGKEGWGNYRKLNFIELLFKLNNWNLPNE